MGPAKRLGPNIGENIMDQKKEIIVTVERPNGTTFTQLLTVKTTIRDTILNYQRDLGRKYLICDWRKA